MEEKMNNPEVEVEKKITLTGFSVTVKANVAYNGVELAFNCETNDADKKAVDDAINGYVKYGTKMALQAAKNLAEGAKVIEKELSFTPTAQASQSAVQTEKKTSGSVLDEVASMNQEELEVISIEPIWERAYKSKMFGEKPKILKSLSPKELIWVGGGALMEDKIVTKDGKKIVESVEGPSCNLIIKTVESSWLKIRAAARKLYDLRRQMGLESYQTDVSWKW